MRKTRPFLLPAEANIAASRVLRALIRSKQPAITATDCQLDFERRYPDLCERYHLSEELLRNEFRSALKDRLGGR